MEIFKELNKKGYKHYYDGTVEELDSMDKDNQHLHSEIMQVIIWLYEKHEIFIQLFPIGEDGKMKFYSKVIINDNGWVKIIHQISNIVNSPTEAYEAAIEYTFKNLI